MLWKIYQLYCWIYWIFKRFFNINLRGLGVISDFIQKPKIFSFKGIYFYFNPLCSRNYCLLPGGIPNEPETHIFLKRIIQSYPKPIIFIDIGASIGEFVFTMAKSNKVTYIYAFEPNEQAAKSMEITKLINNFEEKIKIYTLGISSYDGNASFYLNTRSPTGSKLIMDDFKSDIQVKQVKVSKLDSLFKDQFRIQ